MASRQPCNREIISSTFLDVGFLLSDVLLVVDFEFCAMTLPAELIFTDPCILFALRREAAPFLRLFPPQQSFPGGPCRAWFCGPSWLTVLVLETGVGPAPMEKTLDWLLGVPLLGQVPYRPRVVLCAGFSGALQERCQVGDIILATEVTDAAGNRWPTTWPAELPAGEWRPPVQRGRLLCVPTLLGGPADKQSLGVKHDAVAVDMESAVVARRCSAMSVPFGCVRTISDAMDTPLSPRLVSLLSRGQVSPWRLLAALAGSPRLALELPALARRTRFAARQLAVALGELLTLTLPVHDS